MKTYDPRKVSAIVDGRFIVGFMDGTFITTGKNEDDVAAHVGADGGVTFVEKADETGMIEFTLKQNSSSLPYLRKLAAEKREFAAGVIDGNKDNGDFKAGGNQCRIVKTPGAEFSDDVSGVQVQIFVADYAN